MITYISVKYVSVVHWNTRETTEIVGHLLQVRGDLVPRCVPWYRCFSFKLLGWKQKEPWLGACHKADIVNQLLDDCKTCSRFNSNVKLPLQQWYASFARGAMIKAPRLRVEIALHRHKNLRCVSHDTVVFRLKFLNRSDQRYESEHAKKANVVDLAGKTFFHFFVRSSNFHYTSDIPASRVGSWLKPFAFELKLRMCRI